MCKILLMAGIKPNNNAWLFAKSALPYLSKEDQDGVGYAALSRSLHGERWLNPTIALKTRVAQSLSKSNTGSRIYEDSRYSSFGTLQMNHDVALMLHTRRATTPICIQNTHPFVSQEGKTALIHNGVVQTGGLEFVTSTCDSEGILNLYTQYDVSNNSRNIQNVFNKLNGAFACGVLTEDNNGRKFLDIFVNDSWANLYTCYINELGTNVYCTSPEIIENTAHNLSFTMDTMHHVSPNSFIRMDANTGHILEQFEVVKERQARMNKPKGKKHGRRKVYQRPS